MTPVLLVTGPIGVGKSTVLLEADALLIEAGIPHATVEIEDIARCFPALQEDPETKRAHWSRNLGRLWSNYAARGAERLILSMLVESRSDIRPISAVVPNARVTVVRLRAPLELIESRLRRREPYPEDDISGARWWASRAQNSAVEDHVVDNDGRPAREVAAQVLQVAGWLSRDSDQ